MVALLVSPLSVTMAFLEFQRADQKKVMDFLQELTRIMRKKGTMMTTMMIMVMTTTTIMVMTTTTIMVMITTTIMTTTTTTIMVMITMTIMTTTTEMAMQSTAMADMRG